MNNGRGVNVVNQRLGYLARSGNPDALDSIVPMAFGNLALDLVLEAPERQARVEEDLREVAEVAMAEAALQVDGALSAGGATMELIDLLHKAGPFGAGNPQPIFAFPAHRIAYADLAGKDHVRCQLVAGDGARLQAIAFRSVDTALGELLLSERQLPLHVAGRLVANDWGGSRKPQLLIDDVAIPKVR